LKEKLGFQEIRQLPKIHFPFDLVAKKDKKCYLIDVKFKGNYKKDYVYGGLPTAWPFRACYVKEKLSEKVKQVDLRFFVLLLLQKENEKLEYLFLEPRFDMFETTEKEENIYRKSELDGTINEILEFCAK